MDAPRRRHFGRFDWVELIAVCAFVAAVSSLATAHLFKGRLAQYRFFAQDAMAEAAPLAQRYGPGKHSRNLEEWAIRDFFGDRRNGVFLDVGANHYRDENNTYYLETALGWSGIAIDAQEEFRPGYTAHRPRTKYFAYFVSDVSDDSVRFYVPQENSLVASSSPEFTRREGYEGRPTDVRTITLNDLLSRQGITMLDLLSMDIELAEPKALAGLDIDRFKPALVCIEAHHDVRQRILDYFAEHDYVVVGKYVRLDPKNLYFKPLNSVP